MNDPPPPDIWLAIAKEWYWIFIFLALVLVAFAPSFLKAKCPTCRKRKLRSVDLSDAVRSQLEQLQQDQFTSFFECSNCQARFKRVRSAPLEEASDPSLQVVFARQRASHDI